MAVMLAALLLAIMLGKFDAAAPIPLPTPEPTPTTVEIIQVTPDPRAMRPLQAIEYWTNEYEYSFDKAYKLAICESELKPEAQNEITTAGGLFQFLDGTWNGNCEGDKANAFDNTACAVRLLSAGKKSHWTADPRVPACLAKQGITL